MIYFSQPDDIEEALKKVYKFEINTNVDKFVAAIDKEPHFKPSGELFHSFTHTTGNCVPDTRESKCLRCPSYLYSRDCPSEFSFLLIHQDQKRNLHSHILN